LPNPFKYYDSKRLKNQKEWKENEGGGNEKGICNVLEIEIEVQCIYLHPPS
jgi:hypothetical protein